MCEHHAKIVKLGRYVIKHLAIDLDGLGKDEKKNKIHTHTHKHTHTHTHKYIHTKWLVSLFS